MYYRDGDGLLLFRALAIMGQDLLLAFGAMVFVFFAVRTLATDIFYCFSGCRTVAVTQCCLAPHTQMWVHTRSLFLAAAGIVQVLFSFPLCFFVYRLVLQVKLFGALQTIAVFIILGIGAGKHASQGLPHDITA